mmetsp:Transcript_57910/g.147026  ORF Transcript_57910/g.147026 Transcript_57910/m.147026 type:complete len:197 (+) Transcript_57910:83-673(+)
MGKKGKDKDAEPSFQEEIPEPDGLENPPDPPPEVASAILKDLGWEVFQMPVTYRKYFFSTQRREARVQAPYFEVLGLPETDFRTITKDGIWKAFFQRRATYKQADQEGSLTEELKDEGDRVDWDLIMEAYQVLADQEARAEYEARNLLPQARHQLIGLQVMHEAQVREEAALAEVRAVSEAAAAAAAEAEGEGQAA